MSIVITSPRGCNSLLKSMEKLNISLGSLNNIPIYVIGDTTKSTLLNANNKLNVIKFENSKDSSTFGKILIDKISNNKKNKLLLLFGEKHRKELIKLLKENNITQKCLYSK